MFGSFDMLKNISQKVNEVSAHNSVWIKRGVELIAGKLVVSLFASDVKSFSLLMYCNNHKYFKYSQLL